MTNHSSEPRGERSTQTGTSPPAKTCRRCATAKPRNAFFANRNTRDGLQSYCKSCHNEARRKGGQVGRPRKSPDVIPLSVQFFDQLPDAALIDAPAVGILLGLSPRSLGVVVDRGRLPQPRHEGGRRVWSAGQVRAHLAAGEARQHRADVYTLGGIIQRAREVLGAARVDRMIADARAAA